MKIKVPNQWPKLDPPGIARIAIIGEAPGVTEEQQGIPFCGASGALLNAALSQVGIVRDQCFVGNVCQVRPHGNDFNTLDWSSEEVQSGISQLREDLLAFRPSLILCLGNAALHLLKCGNVAPRKTRQKRKQEDSEPDEQASTEGDENTLNENLKARPDSSGSFLWPSKIGSWRGSLFLSDFLSCPACLDWSGELRMTCPECEGKGFKVKAISTYHPAAVLRDFSLQPYFKADIRRAASESKTRELILPKREIVVFTP